MKKLLMVLGCFMMLFSFSALACGGDDDNRNSLTIEDSETKCGDGDKK